MKSKVELEIGLSDKNRQAVANSLQKLLADEQILYAKTRHYHWNIEGKHFMELHKLYENLYNELAETIDSVAERIRQLGHFAQGRLEDTLKQASLLEDEYTGDADTQLRNLVSDHETLIRSLRKNNEEFAEKYKDVGSADLAADILAQHEKWAWFLRSYLK